jgi:hypothetical protein
MTLVLELPEEVEQSFRASAQKRGMKVEDWLLEAGRFAATGNVSEESRQDTALDELFGCLADVKPIGPGWRQTKEEEMALEEEKFQRHFGQSSP